MMRILVEIAPNTGEPECADVVELDERWERAGRLLRRLNPKRFGELLEKLQTMVAARKAN